ncbi:MAG: GntR family transcriptional regulator [Desulforegulaceae bacterium]|nr:GntR family transcriptional regulator [Desulforegulaceae bacterium]
MEAKYVFKRAIQGRAVEDILLQIEAAILNRDFLPGEKLPSERELQLQFGTGRGVVREALKILKQKDLLEIRKGSRGGAFVKEVEVGKISETLSLFLKQKEIEPEKLIEFRENIDQTITILSIARGSVEEKEYLYGKAVELSKLISCENPDLTLIGEADRELNILLAKMTKNPLFDWIMEAVQFGFSSYDYALYEKEEFRRLTADNWKKTAFEIKSNEPMKALSSIGYHYSLLRQCIEDKKADNNLIKIFRRINGKDKL